MVPKFTIFANLNRFNYTANDSLTISNKTAYAPPPFNPPTAKKLQKWLKSRAGSLCLPFLLTT